MLLLIQFVGKGGKKLKILITGVGITGKSTLRRILVKRLRSLRLTVKHYDADQFRELRDPADADCLKALPDNFEEGTVYVIEDIHGPLRSSILPPGSYDLIFYVKPDIFSHFLFWLQRMWIWFKIGQFSWDPKKGWQGSGRRYDPCNIIPIAQTMARDFRNRRKWIAEDLKAISCFPHVIVHSQWAWRRIRFSFP